MTKHKKNDKNPLMKMRGFFFGCLISTAVMALAPCAQAQQSQATNAYTPPPMFGTPVAQPVAAQTITTEAITTEPVQPSPAPQQQQQPQQTQSVTVTNSPPPAAIAPIPAAQQSPQPLLEQPATTSRAVAPISQPQPSLPPPQTPQEIIQQNTTGPAPTPTQTPTIRAEDLLQFPVTASTKSSGNQLDPLTASALAKSQLPQPKQGEVLDTTGVASKPTPKPIPKAHPIVESAQPKKEKEKKSKGISSSTVKMPVVKTKDVEETTLAPMANVKIAPPPSEKTTKVTNPVSNTNPASNKDSNDTKANIEFTAGQTDLTPAQKAALDKTISSLKTSPTARAQIFAYASPVNAAGSISARRISLVRGLNIRTYITSQGIKSDRIDVRAMGDEIPNKKPTDHPIDRVDILTRTP